MAIRLSLLTYLGFVVNLSVSSNEGMAVSIMTDDPMGSFYSNWGLNVRGGAGSRSSKILANDDPMESFYSNWGLNIRGGSDDGGKIQANDDPMEGFYSNWGLNVRGGAGNGGKILANDDPMESFYSNWGVSVRGGVGHPTDEAQDKTTLQPFPALDETGQGPSSRFCISEKAIEVSSLAAFRQNAHALEDNQLL